MRYVIVHTLRICCLVALIAASAPAIAQLTLEEAVERVQKEIQCRVLKAEELTVGRKKLYRIKLLTRDGRVQVVKISAEEPKESR
ncbi:PepSY domain-containing protein [Tahibacter amnicola]|uniref:PepSY domain-containing protein n=1 Tax=Tahibacter amnicola TaxID=2976241 RepID=A0ABY6BE76_9GAMM|nr:hypothetical protein [Tahibacter amnicola]UXI68087.1 hypothetical protein N4264_00080 [Tahibacter amnicola]